MSQPTPRLDVLEFQTVGTCNARCSICPWPEVGLAGLPRALPEPLWECILESIADNEPLLDRRLEERIARIKAELGNVEIEVPTNGSLFKERRIR